MSNEKAVREHVLELLEGKSAHIDLELALKDFPLERINDDVSGSPHTAWQLLEHIRIAQRDILDFCTNPDYKAMKWPDDYWPRDAGKPDTWKRSVDQIVDDLQAMRDLVSDEKRDLFAKIPHGDGQTILREALLVADHNAYHLGQVVLVKKILAG
jgi:uncharacterized damage-inducible protein DinB